MSQSNNSNAPVVGSECQRLPLEALCRVSSDEVVQNLYFDQYIRMPCENHVRVSRRYRKRCGRLADTHADLGRTEVALCDFCYPKKFWYLLLILCLATPVEAFSVNASDGEVYALLFSWVAIAAMFFFTVDRVATRLFATCFEISSSFVQLISVAWADYMWTAKLQCLVSVFASPFGYRGVLQGAGADSLKTFTSLVKAFAGSLALYEIFVGEVSWAKRVYNFVRNSIFVSYMADCFSRWSSGDFTFPQTQAEVLAAAKDLHRENERLDPNSPSVRVVLTHFKWTEDAYEHVFKHYPLGVRIQLLTAYVNATDSSAVAREVLRLSPDLSSLLIFLAKKYNVRTSDAQLSAEEQPQQKDITAPVNAAANVEDWKDSSWLMNVAAGIDAESASVPHEHVWRSHLLLYKEHCLKCSQPMHFSCPEPLDLKFELSNLVHRKLGSLAWPSTAARCYEEKVVSGAGVGVDVVADVKVCDSVERIEQTRLILPHLQPTASADVAALKENWETVANRRTEVLKEAAVVESLSPHFSAPSILVDDDCAKRFPVPESVKRPLLYPKRQMTVEEREYQEKEKLKSKTVSGFYQGSVSFVEKLRILWGSRVTTFSDKWSSFLDVCQDKRADAEKQCVQWWRHASYKLQKTAVSFSLLMGWVSISKDSDFSVKVSNQELSAAACEVLAEGADFSEEQQLYAHNSFAHKTLVGKTRTVVRDVFSALSVVALLICATAFAFQKSRVQPQGRHGPSGGGQMDKDDDIFEVTSRRGRNQVLAREQQMAADYYEKGKGRYQSAQGVVLGEIVVPEVEKVIYGPIETPPFELQAGFQVPNLETLQVRLFAVYSSEDCSSESYLINAFQAGQFLFCMRHALSNQKVWIRNALGQVFVVEPKWASVADHDDLVCVKWFSPLGVGRVSFAPVSLHDEVALISYTFGKLRVSCGRVLALGTRYAWATYDSKNGDCMGLVVKTNGDIVGLHQVGSQCAAGFLINPACVLDYIQNNKQITAVLQSAHSGRVYCKDDRPYRRSVHNRYPSPYFEAYCATVGADVPKTHGLPVFGDTDMETRLKAYWGSFPLLLEEPFLYAINKLRVILRARIGVTTKASLDYIHSQVDHASGTGYPWCEEFSRKVDLFAAKPTIYKTFGVRPDVVYWLSKLKSEVILKGKLPRVYMASPVDFTYFANQFFLKFNELFVQEGSKLNGFFSTVGMVPQYLGWNRLYESLFPNGIALDGKKFDTRVHPHLLNWVGALRMELFDGTPEDIADIGFCYHNFVHSVVKTAEGYVFTKDAGQPSGGVNTIYDNTMVLFLIVCATFHYLYPDLDFSEEVRLALNGDDALVTLSSKVIPGFDVALFCRTATKLSGMVFESETDKVVPLSQLTYLSRRFEKQRGVWMPVFDFNKMAATLCYSKRPLDVAFNYMRAWAIYCEMWTNKTWAPLLKGYLNYLKPLVEGSSEAKLWEHTESEITQLYFGYQSVVLGELQSATPRKESWYSSLIQMDRQITKVTTTKLVPVSPTATNARTVRNRRKRMKRVAKRQLANAGALPAALPQKQRRVRVQAQVAGNGSRVAANVSRQLSSFADNLGQRAFDASWNRVARASGSRAPVGVRAAELAYAVSCPLDSPNVRVAKKFGGRPTGVATLQERIAAPFPDAAFTGTTTGAGFVFRSALRSAIIGMAWPSTVVVYAADEPAWQVPSNAFTFFGLPLLTDNNSVLRHGPVLWPGKYGKSAPEYGYLMNDGDEFKVEVTPWPAGVTAIALQFWVYTAKGFKSEQAHVLTAAGPSGTFIPNVPLATNSPIYVAACLGFAAPGGATINVPARITLSTGTGTAPSTDSLYYIQRSLPKLAQQLPAIEDVRIIGASLMWTNTTANITKQGQVATAQLTASADFEDYSTYERLSALNPMISKVLPAQDGVYSFLKPTEYSDWEFLNEWESAPSGVSDRFDTFEDGVEEAAFLINSPFEFIGTALSIPFSPTYSTTGYWTMAYKVEYLTDDQWRSLATGSKDDVAFESALAALSLLPQFHTNAMHLADVTNWLKEKFASVKNFAVEHGPTIGKSIEAVLSGLSLLAAI